MERLNFVLNGEEYEYIPMTDRLMKKIVNPTREQSETLLVNHGSYGWQTLDYGNNWNWIKNHVERTEND